jgi:hypothetical protein
MTARLSLPPCTYSLSAPVPDDDTRSPTLPADLSLLVQKDRHTFVVQKIITLMSQTTAHVPLYRIF